MKSGRPRIDAEYASAARAELALAIGRRNAASDRLTALRDEHARIWESRQYPARQAVEAAQRALAMAKSDAADRLTGGVLERGSVSIREARERLTDALDAQEVADAAEAKLTEAIPAAEAEMDAAGREVKHRAAAVLLEHPLAAGMIDHMARLRREYTETSALAAFLVDNNVIPIRDERGYNLPGDAAEAARHMQQLIQTMPRFWSFPTEGQGLFRTAPDLMRATIAPWAGALAALENDATAPLPELPQ